MRICHINLASGYHGGENQTLTLIKHQIKIGYSLTVVANPISPFYQAVKQLNCKLVPAKHFMHSHSKSITKDCDVVHVHEGRAIYWALIQNLLFKIPYIITRRIDNPLKKKFLANLAYSKASALIGLSTVIVERIREAYPQANIHKIPSSPVSYKVNYDNVTALKQRFQDKFLVIHAANMVKHKAFDVSIDAMKMLANNHPNIHLALLGDGKERGNLEKLADNAKNISFEGKQSNMGDWFEVAQLQIHPSHSEGLGSVILEGIKAGLPVIGTNTGGIPDIIEHKKNGLLVKSNDPEKLSKAIIDIKENFELRQQLIINGQEKIKHFDIIITAERYKAIYLDIKHNTNG